MEFDAVLLPPRRQASVAAGLWPDRTLNDALDAAVARHPDHLALTAVEVEDGAVRRFTYRELATMADRIAVGLTRLGVARNDVVAVQLPNGWALTVLYLACVRIGAVFNPLMPIFRERELSFMLGHGQAKVLVVPQHWRGFDHEDMALRLQANLPALKNVIVVGGEGPNRFDARLSDPAWELEPDADDLLSRHRPGPDDVTQLIYTSGTTGEPKGAMHSSNTLLANIRPYAERLRLDADEVILMASPMAHQTGFMYGLMMPVLLGAYAVLQDLWEPRKAVALIRAEHVTFTMASTPFLTDLTRVVRESGQELPTLRTFLCAGAPIPGALVEQAREVLDVKIVSAWGMTECGAVTLTRLEDEDERSVNTDGCPLPGVDIRVVDADGQVLPTNEAGRLQLRACSNFGGYLKRPHLNGTDADGWFETGDLARIDARGYVRITGRAKDVIIRGGENIPVLEVESLLYRHPAVAQVAVVAYPDERLGERACAIVVTKPGQTIDFAGMVEFLKAQQMALQYLPERMIVLDAMPVTPSGKIQKFKLRDQLRNGELGGA